MRVKWINNLYVLLTLLLIGCASTVSEPDEAKDLVDEEIRTYSTKCTDSDGGKDANTKGTVLYYFTSGNETYNKTKADSCSGDQVIERFCEDQEAQKTKVTCAYGCSNGACNPKPN